MDGGFLGELIEVAKEIVINPVNFSAGVQRAARQSNFPAASVFETNQLDGSVQGFAGLAFPRQDIDFADSFSEGLREQNVLARDADDAAKTIGARSAF